MTLRLEKDIPITERVVATGFPDRRPPPNPAKCVGRRGKQRNTVTDCHKLLLRFLLGCFPPCYRMAGALRLGLLEEARRHRSQCTLTLTDQERGTRDAVKANWKP